MRQKLLSFLLAVALLAGTAVPARCEGQPAVVCETGVKEGVVSLSLEGLDGGAVYGVQVELTLSGDYGRCTFTPASQSAYSPGCRAESRRGATVVTIYLTDRAALNKGTALDLGELDLGTGVDWDVLPETAGVILLDQQLRPMAASGKLPVTATAPAGSSHNPGTPSAPDHQPPWPMSPPMPSCPTPGTASSPLT